MSIYFNFAGQVMLSVFVGDPDGAATGWRTFTNYDSEGRVVLTQLHKNYKGIENTLKVRTMNMNITVADASAIIAAGNPGAGPQAPIIVNPNTNK